MPKFSRRELLAGAVLVSASTLIGCDPKPSVEVKPEQSGVTVAPQETSTPAPEVSAGTPISGDPQPSVEVKPEQSGVTVAPQETSTPTPKPAYLAVARGDSAEEITKRALAALGGMERFVKEGYDVIIKPNICNANHGPEYASTTNPQVVATLVKLALAAGAKRVRVMDSPFAGTMPAAYAKSGIGAAVEAAGGEMEIIKPARFVQVEIPDGVDLKEWSFYQPVLDADLVINVPIAKHHSLTKLTLGGKNLMGIIQNRPAMHRNPGQRIADLTSLVRPQLTVVDAVRMLMANGPTGGNLADVKQANTVIASHDIVAADAYAATLFDMRPDEIAYIAAADSMGIGTMDLTNIKIEELRV